LQNHAVDAALRHRQGCRSCDTGAGGCIARCAGRKARAAQIANAAGIGAIGAAFFVIEAATCRRLALFAAFALFALSIGASAAFLSRMRRAST